LLEHAGRVKATQASQLQEKNMLLPAPPLYPRKRKPKVKAPRSAPPPAALTLVLNTSEAVPLVADGLDAEKWVGTYEGGAMTSYAAEVVAFDRITVTLQGTPGAGGASSVSYAADPSDVSDTSGRQLAAFDDYPL
jgi:hypothetical protein